MASPRWLLIPVLFASAAGGFAACSDGAQTTAGTASGASSGMGGTGGAGAGGAPGTTASTGTASPDAGPPAPLVCKNHTYSTIKEGPCDLLQQDCPEGRTCKEFQSLNGSWTTHCVTASGLKGEGEKCAADEECLAKLSCAVGRCAPVCCAATNEPCLGGICNLFIQLDGTNTVNKQVCHYAEACTLLVEDACDKGFSCHVEDNKQGLATCIDSSGSPAPDLGDCHFLNDCSDMEHCLGGSKSKVGKCHFYCYLGQPDPLSPGAALGGCPVGQACTAGPVDKLTFSFGLPEIGLCAPFD